VNKKTLVLLMVLGGALGVWKVVQERHDQTHPVLATSEDFIGYASGQAVADAAQYDHITLDYSIPSLKQVDVILGRLHEIYVKSPSSMSVRGLAAEYGAYVGEVIRRNEGNAYWTRDSKVAGEKSYPLHWNKGESYPFAWCARRITDGEEDSIWFKYSVLKDPDWKQHVSDDVHAGKALRVSRKPSGSAD
jgi:hypothetical protein